LEFHQGIQADQSRRAALRATLGVTCSDKESFFFKIHFSAQLRWKNQAARFIDCRRERLAMEETLKHLTLHRSTWEGVDLGVHLFDGFHGVTL